MSDPFDVDEVVTRVDRLKREYPSERMLRLPEVRAARNLDKKYDDERGTSTWRSVQDEEGHAWRKAIRAVRRTTGLSRDDAVLVVMHAVHS